MVDFKDLYNVGKFFKAGDQIKMNVGTYTIPVDGYYCYTESVQRIPMPEDKKVEE